MGQGDQILYFQYLSTICHLSVGEGGGEIEVDGVSDAVGLLGVQQDGPLGHLVHEEHELSLRPTVHLRLICHLDFRFCNFHIIRTSVHYNIQLFHHVTEETRASENAEELRILLSFIISISSNRAYSNCE